MALINIGRYHINPERINYIERTSDGLHIVFDGEYTVFVTEKNGEGQLTTEYIMTQLMITKGLVELDINSAYPVMEENNGDESSADAHDDKENGEADKPA